MTEELREAITWQLCGAAVTVCGFAFYHFGLGLASLGLFVVWIGYNGERAIKAKPSSEDTP